ncbi:MAG: AbrB/MazE/SpoVT family DNA-binding domain-containing protein [Candidatus Latescibacterota bacterium]
MDRTRDVKLVPVGNSLGIRLPKDLRQRYGFGPVVSLVETEEGILLRSKGDDILSWEDTFREMAKESEDWSDLEVTLADGLEDDAGPEEV